MDKFSQQSEADIEKMSRYIDGSYVAENSSVCVDVARNQNLVNRKNLYNYLEQNIIPTLAQMGFSISIRDNPDRSIFPFLLAVRMENHRLPTVLTYAHCDVGQDLAENCSEGFSSRGMLDEDDDQFDKNNALHWIYINALQAVLSKRGKLGFNCKFLIETAKGINSESLNEFCKQNISELAADFLLASEGLSLKPILPTIFLGSRGGFTFKLSVNLREETLRSGDWVLKDPGIILSHALSTIVDAKGRFQIEEWKPVSLTRDIRQVLKGCTAKNSSNEDLIDEDWGGAKLSLSEKVFGWNQFSVISLKCGNPYQAGSVIPPNAEAICQFVCVVGTDMEGILPALRCHLDEYGFDQVKIEKNDAYRFMPTRSSPDNPWVKWVASSIYETTGKKPAVIPNLGGCTPNDAFTEVLGIPTVWVPHYFKSCKKGDSSKYTDFPIENEGLNIMSGLFWDLGNKKDARNNSR